MLLDVRKDPGLASRIDAVFIVDDVNGEREITNRCFAFDEQAGYALCYVRDHKGIVLLNLTPGSPNYRTPLKETLRGDLRIVWAKAA